MSVIFDLFLLLIVCNYATPYFAVGETFGFSSMEEPSWSSSFGDDDDNFNQVVEDDPRPMTTPQPTTVTPTTSPPTTRPPSTTRRQRRPGPQNPKRPNRRPPTDEVPREIPVFPDQTTDDNEDRLQIVNTILAFKNIVRSIETEMAAVKETCEVCSVTSSVAQPDNTIPDTNFCESSRDSDAKMKQQLRDLKSSVRSIDETLRQMGIAIGRIGVHLSGVQPIDCMEMFLRGQTSSGVFYLQPRDVDRAFLSYCDMTDGGGWTIIQRRTDTSIDFNRGMGSYRRGFGDPNYSHWLGLDKIHSLLVQDEYQLRIEVGLFNGRVEHAYYDHFKIGGYEANYKLTVGNYNGTAGDALTFHNGLPFTTKDRDNDFAQGHNCASIYKGGWWFGNCMYANLNGVNIAKQDTDSSAMGIIWYDLTGFHSSLRFASMAIRPTS